MDSCSQLSVNLLIDGLKEDAAEKNLLVSPLSYNIILNMIAGAATGATLKEILDFLKCDQIKDVNSNSSNMMLSASSTGEEKSDNGAVIHILNGIWLDQHYRLKPSYEQLAQHIYKAHVKNIDFLNKADEVVQDANEWAKAATKGLMTEFLQKSDLADVTFVIGNAIHFKGTWSEVFNPRWTENKHFYLLNGSKKSVPFMTGCSDFYHCDYPSFELVKIPYRKGDNGNDFSMYIFLPNERDGLDSLLNEAASDVGFFHKEYTFLGMYESNYYISPFWVPKFKFSYLTSKAKQTMQEMGLKSPFDPVTSELKEMVDEQLFVSKVFQKCFIEVDELGTQAVAITSLCGGGGPPPRMFIADHPFLFMIREDKSKVVLFTGVVLDPSLTT